MEDVLHALRDCPCVWKQLLHEPSWKSFFSLSLEDCLRSNLDVVVHDARYVIKFAAACWRLWTRRCNCLFRDEEMVLDNVALACNILTTAR